MKMYILINKDIEITKGKLAGQVSHSVMRYFYLKYKEDDLDEIKDYMEGKEKKIMLAVSEKELLKLEKDNIENNLGYSVVRDAGYTELEPNTLTCICLGIFKEEDTPKKVKRMRLYKG